jgi:hypothetical protein
LKYKPSVPLVSGVCRMASAPTLSHGGSRLNASKPEANPKTRCPNTPKPKTCVCIPKIITPSNRHPKHRRQCRPRGRQVRDRITRVPPYCWSSSSRRSTDTTHQTKTYVPLQTREHAWAGMSGTLRCFHRGSRGTLRPEALNLECTAG